MSQTPRKIVFSIPALLSEPAAEPPAEPRDPRSPDLTESRKLGTIMEVSQALTGTLNLQAGLYGVLEVLERRCGALRGSVTLLEEASGLLAVEAALGYPRNTGRVRYRVG